MNIVDILNKSDNNSFRKSNDINSESYIFDTPIETAKEIVNELAKKTTRSHHVMLVAKMQSGKTSVCNATVNIINATKLNIFMGIDKFMFISGMNDCGLKNQTSIRLQEQVIGATNENIYTGKNSEKTVKGCKFFVMKNSDLMKFEGDINNSLIFIDESHYGSNERNILTQFLLKHGANWKNPIDLIKRNIFIVSVSATPFDEIVSDKAECKKIIELKTDNNYVGISEYIDNGLIFDANKNDIKDGTIFNYILDAKSRMDENENNGIIFIRTRDFDSIENNNEIKNIFDFIELKSTNKSIEYDKLNEKIRRLVDVNKYNKRLKNMVLSHGRKPSLVVSRPIIVLLKGAFRAGITLPSEFKDYIYMVYDYSLKADTTAQALLGRMCGYRNNDNGFKNTYFYINKKFADMYSSWETDFKNRETIPFNNSKWTWVDINYEGETEIGSKTCGNITISLTEDEIKEIYGALFYKRNKLSIMEKIFPSILSKKGINLPYDYIEEVLMSGKNNYAKSSQTRRFDNFTSELLVFPFRPDKIKKFYTDTERTFLTKEDLGKKCVSVVLDAEIYKNINGTIEIKGNKRLLVYYVEVAQKALLANREGMYKIHKDTTLIN